METETSGSGLAIPSQATPAKPPQSCAAVILVDADGGQFLDEALWVFGVDGLAPRKIKELNPLLERYATSPYDFYSDLSPDGKQIVYSTCEFGIPGGQLYPENRKIPWYELAIADIDGNNTKRLTESTEYENYPSWSPDGTRIAYLSRERHPYASGWEGRIVVATITPPGEIKEVASYGTHAASIQPVWSPDGRYLAFAEYAVHDGRVTDRESVVLIAEPGNLDAEIVSLGQSSTAAAWSPDSKRIAVAPIYNDYSRDSAIVTYNPDGTGITVVWESDSEILDMDWHPEGTEILTVTHGSPKLLTVGVNGERTRRLLPAQSPLVPAKASWSHDGKTIAVRSGRTDNYNSHGLTVVTMNREGDDIRLLAIGGPETGFEVRTCHGAPAWDGLSDARDTCVAREE